MRKHLSLYIHILIHLFFNISLFLIKFWFYRDWSEFVPAMFSIAVTATLAIAYYETSSSLTMEKKRTVTLEKENTELTERWNEVQKRSTTRCQ